MKESGSGLWTKSWTPACMKKAQVKSYLDMHLQPMVGHNVWKELRKVLSHLSVALLLRKLKERGHKEFHIISENPSQDLKEYEPVLKLLLFCFSCHENTGFELPFFLFLSLLTFTTKCNTKVPSRKNFPTNVHCFPRIVTGPLSLTASVVTSWEH